MSDETKSYVYWMSRYDGVIKAQVIRENKTTIFYNRGPNTPEQKVLKARMTVASGFGHTIAIYRDDPSMEAKWAEKMEVFRFQKKLQHLESLSHDPKIRKLIFDIELEGESK